MSLPVLAAGPLRIYSGFGIQFTILWLIANSSIACRLHTGTAVEISGVWKRCPPGKEQTHELQTTNVDVVGPADPVVGCRYSHDQRNEVG